MREIGVGVIFRLQGQEKGLETKIAFPWPNGHPRKYLPDGPALTGEHIDSVKKHENETKQDQWDWCFHKFLVRGQGVARPLPLRSLTAGLRICLVYFVNAAERLAGHISGSKVGLSW